MRIDETGIPGCVLIRPKQFQDHRGSFDEHFNVDRFREHDLPVMFPQDNVSYSHAGVIRGLHMQRKYPQGKLIRVMRGSIVDICVDVRPNSPTFKKWHAVLLDEWQGHSFYVPEGCLHGFMAIQPSVVLYKCTTLYDSQSDGGVRFDDPELNIPWHRGLPDNMKPIVSDKDLKLPSLKEFLER